MPKALYKKLNLSKDEFREHLLSLYWEQQFSQKEIAEYYKVDISCIETWFKKLNLQTRTLSEALTNRWLNEHSFSNEQFEQINGWMLSDGHIEKTKSSARFSIGLKYKEPLGQIQTSIPLKYTPIWKSPKTNCYHIKSHSYPFFLSMRQHWYDPNRNKIVPKDITITPTTLYFWFIGDGCRVKSGIQMSTEGFQLQDIEILSNKLQHIGLENSILGNKRIRIKSKSISLFYDYIGECKHKVYDYKWKLNDK